MSIFNRIMSILKKKMYGNKYGSCDTFVVLPPHTAGGRVVFGKNSDRPSSEIQEIVYQAACKHPANSMLKCTYIEIEQANETYAVILSKPNWMWGAEMGANEKGVCIGNEAVYTNLESPDDLEPRLLGMDLVRLGLERGATAFEAVELITQLLEKYGQGGPCSDTMPDFVYHNSFLICDSKEAWVLETAGNYWAAERVTSGYRNISNCLSIGTKIDLMSAGLKEKAVELGLWNGEDEFNFTKTFSSDCNPGCDRFFNGGKLLKNLTSNGKFCAGEMFQILRDEDSGICMSDGAFVSTGSQVSVLSPEGSQRPAVHWLTGTPDPRTSIFKPFVFTGSDKFTNLLTAPTNGERSTERKHRIYALREAALKSKPQVFGTLKDLELKCCNELEEFLELIETGSAEVSELDGLFNDCAETEAKFYAGQSSL